MASLQAQGRGTLRAMKLGPRVVGVVIVALSGSTAACYSPDDEARDDFSRAFSCPKNGIVLRKRSDLDAYALAHGGGGARKPSPEVAADPQRLAVWQADQQKSRDFWNSRGPVVFEVKGCGHETLYGCDTSTSRGGGSSRNTGWGCVEEYYPPGASVWDPAASAHLEPAPPVPYRPEPPAASVLTPATLASAPLDSSKRLRSTPLDAPPINGDWAPFDVLANLAWASSIATTWSPDARLWSLSLGPRLDGAANLSAGHDWVLLRYNSPGRGDVDLTVALHPPRNGSGDATASHVDVSVDPHVDTTTRDQLPIPRCSLARAFTLLRSASGLAKANTRYAVTAGLVLVGRTAYWSVSYVPGSGSGGVEDFVNAATCAIAHPK